MDFPIEPLTVPLRWHEGGVLRVGNTRISLDLVVNEHNAGQRPEEIVVAHATLSLPDVFAVLAYYLQNRDKVEAYLARRRKQADALRQEIEKHQSPQSELKKKLRDRWEALQAHASTGDG
jgi:uncharacterized protein (DUF433 family)